MQKRFVFARNGAWGPLLTTSGQTPEVQGFVLKHLDC